MIALAVASQARARGQCGQASAARNRPAPTARAELPLFAEPGAADSQTPTPGEELAEIVTPLLLHHQSPEVRARALRVARYTKVDRAGMAHSLEVREPLLDHPLVEWLATLPSSLKLNGQQGK